jgi:SAM-dependent methyltransferase
MAQVTRGLRGVLSSPLVYGAFQNLMGTRQGWVDFVQEFVRPSPGGRLLDIGSGPGEQLFYLPEMEYWGFDISETYIEHVKGEFGARGSFLCKIADGRRPEDDASIRCGSCLWRLAPHG